MKGSDAGQISSLFHQGFANLGKIEIPERSLQDLIKYCQELIKWNRKVNLVAKNTSVKDIVEKHFLDSLTLLPVLDKHVAMHKRLLDVGSGAGFPGLVIKAVCPDRSVTLLEPRQRRVSFLNHIIRTLAIHDINVLAQRTDEIVLSSQRNFSLITGRAVADVTAFLEMVEHLAVSGTLVACMQGSSGRKQWEGAQDNQQFSRVSLEHIRLPFSQADRFILLFRKK